MKGRVNEATDARGHARLTEVEPTPAYRFLGACLGVLGDLAAPLSHRPYRGACCVKRHNLFVAAGPGSELAAMSDELLVRHTRRGPVSP